MAARSFAALWMTGAIFWGRRAIGGGCAAPNYSLSSFTPQPPVILNEERVKDLVAFAARML